MRATIADPSVRGMALVSTLFASAVLLTLTATLFLAGFLDAQATANVTAGNEALYVAEAGVHHLWSELEPAPDFARELSWQGGVPPFGALAWFPEPPRTYRVRVAPGASGSLRVISEGSGARGTRRTIEAVFHREERFHPAAPLVVADSATRTIAGRLAATTNDRDGDAASAVPIGAESREAARALAAARGGPPVPVIGPSGITAVLPYLRAEPDRRTAGPHGDARFGSSGAPELVHLVTNAEVEGAVAAFGLVVADAPLRVTGRLEVDGLLAAAGGLEVEGSLIVHGALWVAGGLEVSSGGSIAVEHASRALAAADRLRPGRLPREAVLGAWREVW